jgi:hypothetical protein
MQLDPLQAIEQLFPKFSPQKIPKSSFSFVNPFQVSTLSQGERNILRM